MIDDVLLWLNNPMLMIPLTSIGIIIAVIVAKGGIQSVVNIFNTGKAIFSGIQENLPK